MAISKLVRLHEHGHDHSHDHSHSHSHTHNHVGTNTHSHSHDSGADTKERGEIIRLEQNLLAKNDHIAAHNRDWFAEHQILALNLLGSPGAGKTTLLERTLTDIGAELSCSVIEGDQATQHDADRIREAGGKAVQVNTGPGCHLEADMIANSLIGLNPDPSSIVFLENVGNLVCPALFDLGESKRVVLLSVTEGEDKPLKYPHMFRSADLVLLHKSDLLPHLNFSVEKCMDYARQVKPDVKIMALSSTTGEGMQAWYDWLRQERAELFTRTAGSEPVVSKGGSL